MDVGMLWFDNDPKSDLQSKVSKAAEYFQSKYGQVPNLCFVHPSMISGAKTDAGNIAVCSKSSMILHHFWIGVHSQSNTRS